MCVHSRGFGEYDNYLSDGSNGDHIGSNMSACVLLNLLNKLGEK